MVNNENALIKMMQDLIYLLMLTVSFVKNVCGFLTVDTGNVDIRIYFAKGTFCYVNYNTVCEVIII